MQKQLESPVPAPWRERFMLVGLLAGMVGLMGVSAWFGALNQDEGWYLYAGRMVTEGKVPYRDFASTQGPVMSYVYAAAYPLVTVGGLLAGRLFTALLGAVALGLAMLQAARLAGPAKSMPLRAALLAGGLLGLNLYHVYFTTLVKTYALAAVWVLGALLLLDAGWQIMLAGDAASKRRHESRPRIAMLCGLAGGFLLALAAGTRLSAGILLPVWWLTLLVRGWRFRSQHAYPLLLAGMLAGGTLGMALVFGPFLLLAPDGLQFGLLQYHAGRTSPDGIKAVAYKLGFLLRWFQGYFPLFAFGMLAWLLPWSKPACGMGEQHPDRPISPWLIGMALLAVSLVHVSAAFPYDDYQVFVMPLAAAWVGARLARLLQRMPLRAPVVTAAILMLLFLGSLASPRLQGWLLAERDRIWWPLREQSPIQQLQQVAQVIRTQTPGGAPDLLLTQDIYLAVESRSRVPSGWELGPFCYFPDLSEEDAVRYGVMNRARMLQTLQTTDAPWAAVSGYGFAIAAPSITPVDEADAAHFRQVLSARFVPVAEWSGFGQAATTLQVYERRGNHDAYNP